VIPGLVGLGLVVAGIPVVADLGVAVFRVGVIPGAILVLLEFRLLGRCPGGSRPAPMIIGRLLPIRLGLILPIHLPGSPRRLPGPAALSGAFLVAGTPGAAAGSVDAAPVARAEAARAAVLPVGRGPAAPGLALGLVRSPLKKPLLDAPRKPLVADPALVPWAARPWAAAAARTTRTPSTTGST